MSRIHYFNPGHETAVLLGSRNYTPPANVRGMQKDLALLPIWYAEPEDFVYVSEITSPCFLSTLPVEFHSFPTPVTSATITDKASASTDLQATPWGISPQSLNLFSKLQEDTGLSLSIPDWKEEYARLTGRQTAAVCLERIHALLPSLPIPAAPCFCAKMDEIETYMTSGDAPFLLKTPYSSSGRGLLWVMKKELETNDKNWINGALNKQGSVSIEHGLDKRQDFAMEFYSDGQGHVRYEGLSVFNTEERGAYTGNLLEEQTSMQERITRFTTEEAFLRIQATVTQVLSEIYGPVYTGYLGVDMLVYKLKDDSYAIHPCIEINMRYTMGMVALRLYRKYIAPGATGDFRVSFEKESKDAYDKHLFMKDTYPLKLENGRIREGYLSLCPVTKETHYRAYLLIS